MKYLVLLSFSGFWFGIMTILVPVVSAQHNPMATHDASVKQWLQAQDEAVRQQLDDNEQAWLDSVAQAERLWQQAHTVDSASRWVKYGGGGTTRAVVDYEKNETEVAVLVEAGKASNESRRDVVSKLSGQFKQIMNESVGGTPILERQFAGPEEEGKYLTPDGAEKYIEELAETKLEKEVHPILGGDGVERLMYKVRVPMVPDSLQRRAEKYLPLVRKYAALNNLEVSLCCALVHVESYWNPRCTTKRSSAKGLMQIIWRTAGKDTWKRFYRDQEPPPTSEEFFDPETNLKYGLRYFRLVYEKYLPEIKDDTKRLLAAIISYNCGHGCFKKHVLVGIEPDKMTRKEFLDWCIKKAPNRWKGKRKSYLELVLEKKRLYTQWDNPTSSTTASGN
jgi:hypothetical protein